MSGWKLVTRELYAAGRPMKRVEFDHGADGADPYKGLRDARRMGLVRSIRQSKFQWVWEITPEGRAWVEGRLALIVPPSKSNTGGRAAGTRLRAVATWLKALPGTNEVRI
jgi:hypothetical protein